jgi:hypothetical protein
MCLVLAGGSLVHAQAPADAAAETHATSSGSATPPSQTTSWKDRMFFGGGLGLGFGDIDYVSLEPIIGVRVHPQVALGASVLYRWINDNRYPDSVSTTDYGATTFVQYFPVPTFFLQAEYDYLNYEYVLSDFSTVRSTNSSVFAGAGFCQSIGGKASFFMSALYNLSYDANDPLSPYASPWLYRAGVAVGF